MYFKKMDKATYHIENSYRSISLTNLFDKIYERILLHTATIILEGKKFFEGKNLKKNRNSPQALLPLAEQMHEATANLGIVIDENVTFTSHIEKITIKCKEA